MARAFWARWLRCRRARTAAEGAAPSHANTAERGATQTRHTLSESSPLHACSVGLTAGCGRGRLSRLSRAAQLRRKRRRRQREKHACARVSTAASMPRKSAHTVEDVQHRLAGAHVGHHDGGCAPGRLDARPAQVTPHCAARVRAGEPRLPRPARAQRGAPVSVTPLLALSVRAASMVPVVTAASTMCVASSPRPFSCATARSSPRASTPSDTSAASKADVASGSLMLQHDSAGRGKRGAPALRGASSVQRTTVLFSVGASRPEARTSAASVESCGVSFSACKL